MREIKFRALVENKQTKERHWEYYYTLCEPAWLDCYRVIVRDLEFVGLRDKNGKEMYEGDIINQGEGYSYQIGKIKFGDGKFYCTVGMDWGEIETTCEIIGNIYENPELLK